MRPARASARFAAAAVAAWWALLCLLGCGGAPRAERAPAPVAETEPEDKPIEAAPSAPENAPPPPRANANPAHPGGASGAPLPHARPTAPDDAEEALPGFDWPPPPASARYVLSRELFVGERPEVVRLGDVETALSRALETAGHSERAYYGIPGGFALVTRLEQTDAQGYPMSGAERWALQPPRLRSFSLGGYLSALFRARPGYFRVLVFAVTSAPFSHEGPPPGRAEALEWLNKGADRLPRSLVERPFTVAHAVTALVYEFEIPDRGQRAVHRVPGRLSGLDHLSRGGILGGFSP